MPELTSRNITARLKRPGDRCFKDATMTLTLPFTGSRVADDELAAAELKARGYVVNTIISQRGPRLT